MLFWELMIQFVSQIIRQKLICVNSNTLLGETRVWEGSVEQSYYIVYLITAAHVQNLLKPN